MDDERPPAIESSPESGKVSQLTEVRIRISDNQLWTRFKIIALKRDKDLSNLLESVIKDFVDAVEAGKEDNLPSKRKWDDHSTPDGVSVKKWRY